MSTKLERWFCQPEGSLIEIFLAVLPFFLMGVLPGIFSLVPAIRNLPLTIGLLILLLLTLALVFVGIIGLIVRLPRWTLVYIGILLTIFSLGSIFLIYQIAPPIHLGTQWGTFLNSAVLLSLHLVLLFLLVAVLVGITRKIPWTREFSLALSRDPINISFMLFGGTFLLILGRYEDVPGGNLYLILSSLMMGVGAGGFLQQEKSNYQLALLISTTSAAALFAVVANFTLVAYQARTTRFLGLLIPMPALYGGLSYLIAIAMITLPLLVVKPSARIKAADKSSA